MTWEPSLEVALLIQRCGKGDVEAMTELWPHLFTTPIDVKRPLSDLAQDLADRITELMPPEEKKTPDPNALIEDAIAAVGKVIDTLMGPAGKKT